MSKYPTLITGKFVEAITGGSGSDLFLASELIKKGHNDVDITKLMGQNIKRVMEAAEKAADKLQKTPSVN